MKQRTQARISPRYKLQKTNSENTNRTLTVKQLSVLLYHFYLTLENPDFLFCDSDKSLSQFQADLNQTVTISKENLEKLLWHLENAFEHKIYWNPERADFAAFIESFLEKGEKFDRLTCLIMSKK